MSNAAKNDDILATIIRVLHNYFDGPAKLFSGLAILYKIFRYLSDLYAYTNLRNQKKVFDSIYMPRIKI